MCMEGRGIAFHKRGFSVHFVPGTDILFNFLQIMILNVTSGSLKFGHIVQFALEMLGLEHFFSTWHMHAKTWVSDRFP